MSDERSAPKHYRIHGKHVRDIGCTRGEEGKASVLAEEPDVTFEESDPATCPACATHVVARSRLTGRLFGCASNEAGRECLEADVRDNNANGDDLYIGSLDEKDCPLCTSASQETP